MASRLDQMNADAVQFIYERQIQEEKDLNEFGEVKRVSTFRRVVPQVLACTVKNLILFDLGMTLAFPTIVIPVLLHSNTGLHFTISYASWFGSIGYICQPLGSILSGVVLESLGRKTSMLLGNVPIIVSWILFYTAGPLFTLFTAIILMGLAVGFMQAPIITYVGEISEPMMRSIMTSYAGIFCSVGFVMIYALGNLTSWQNVAGISCAVPVITIIGLSQVPETPQWLLSRGRLQEAEKALCWLRGWVEPRAVRQELTEMIHHCLRSQLRKEPTDDRFARVACANQVNIDDEEKADSKPRVTLEMNDKVLGDENKASIDDVKKNEFAIEDLVNQMNSKPNNNDGMCNKHDYETGHNVGDHDIDWKVKLKDFMRPEMLRPLGLVIGFFFFQNAAGAAAMRPFFIGVFDELHFPITSLHANVLFSVMQLVATILCMLTVRWAGQRPIALVSLLACAIATTVTGVYTFLAKSDAQTGWLPFLMFFVFQFFTGYGVLPVPWMLVSDVFPLRGRSLASGLAAASSYVFNFVATNTFLGLEASLTLGGVLLLYGTLSFLGVAFLFRFMIETVGRSLEDIEQDFKTKKTSKYCHRVIKNPN